LSQRARKVGRYPDVRIDDAFFKADLVHDGVLHPVDQFLASSVSIYESGSVVGRVADILIKRSLWWALEHLNLVNSEVDESASAKWKRVCGDYVVTAPLEVSYVILHGIVSILNPIVCYAPDRGLLT
jgi:hypothetical protein